MSWRQDAPPGARAFIQIEKGSWRIKIGRESIDLVLLVINQRGVEKPLQVKTSLGANASLAAGRSDQRRQPPRMPN